MHNVGNTKDFYSNKGNPLTEEVSPSKFVSETLDKENYREFLKQEDISRIAGFCYSSYGPSGRVSFEIIGSVGQFVIELGRSKDKLKEDYIQSLTFILHVRKSHWVSLVVIYKKSNFIAYHVDSLGVEIDHSYKKVLEDHSIVVKDFSITQQSDGYNCGIFSLENSKIINDAIDESEEKIMQKLKDYQPGENDLKEKRRYFAKILRSQLSVKRKLEADFVCTQQEGKQGFDGSKKIRIVSPIVEQSKPELVLGSELTNQASLKRSSDLDLNSPVSKQRSDVDNSNTYDGSLKLQKDKSRINTILKIFVEEFVSTFEERLKDYSDEITEGKEKHSSILSRFITLGLVGGGIKSAASIISASAKLGPTLASAVTSTATVGGNVIDFFSSKVFQALHIGKGERVIKNVRNIEVSKPQLKEVLVRASISIFCHYYYQYMNMIENNRSGQELGVKILAKVAVQRVMFYLSIQKENRETKKLEKFLEGLYNMIEKGIVLGSSNIREIKNIAKEKFIGLFTSVNFPSCQSKGLGSASDENMYKMVGLINITNEGSSNQYYKKKKQI